ncbi:hypothetical protein [Dysgonomonas sp. HGC4]|uniref:hypothetical protein n=1 Tax=Dysgonomonas sp. HGC4 TaxID=1658009 RepID=UPI0006826774|nr:hypothetical protein [Dysgonomonas sp. HGC4]MBD8349288.1 hypothetical protein [Dysgonomonas sp. HGC4]
MVTIVGFKQCESKDGKQFVALEIQGELRLIQSETTGKFYLTANKTSISTSFPLQVCQTLLGKQLPGNVDKVECEPYEYVNKETGEVLTLFHTYVYSSEKKAILNHSMQPSYIQEPFIQQNQASLGQFSLSGVIGAA